MPKRTDIRTILIIGSGPITIGQGCEFDYSGVQACRALREEGYRVVLINSNPATIMTDPEFADATFIEPITPDAVERILAKYAGTPDAIDAVLPTLGGQTGLNTAMACYDRGIFTQYNVKMIGANRDAINRGEDRQIFKDLMLQIGLKVPKSGVVHTMADARNVLKELGLPLIIRPAFTLGGTGGGIAYNVDEFEETVQRGLDASPVTEVLIEQSVLGWKEYELEVMRDKADNVVIICSIENIDPMGVHTGDSITVAPIQTLTDKEYQRMRDAAIAVIRAVGVETGGSNIQFAINPDNGEMVVVEMNPRVSRSSALASKATGYPIAKIAAKLAVGYTLDELPNYITSKPDKSLHTSACFEPTIDYVVIKIPRWTFEKFPDADETLTTQMKSVGEAMAIGRTFKEALQKGIRSMEVKRFGFGLDKYDKWLNAEHGKANAPPRPPKATAFTNVLFLVLWAIPVFVAAPFLIDFVALHHNYPFTDIPFPIRGFSSEKSHFEELTSWQRLLDIARHITLPLVVLFYGNFAAQSRLSRAVFLDTMRHDFVKTAKAKGVSRYALYFRHIGKYSCLPLVTSVAGSFGLILGGSVIVETIFEIHGFGKFFYDSIVNRDYNVMMFSALVGSFLSLLGYLVADIVYMVCDPRVTLKERAW